MQLLHWRGLMSQHNFILTKEEYEIVYGLCVKQKDMYNDILKRTDNHKDKISWQNQINKINLIIRKLNKAHIETNK